MSTYFDIGCRDCKRLMGIENANRREATLLHFVKHRQVFEGLFGARLDGIELDVSFFEEHKAHRLAVYCEYESFEAAEKRFEANQSWIDFKKDSRKGNPC